MQGVRSEALLKKPLYVYDIPVEILDGLHTKLEAVPFTSEAERHPSSFSPQCASQSASAESDTQHGENRASIYCGLCSLTFDTFLRQRSHVRSDFHKYNTKLKLRGIKPVSEAEFDRVVGELDESISGSDSANSESSFETGKTTLRRNDDTVLSALVEQQATLEGDIAETRPHQKHQIGPGKAPLIWFRSTVLEPNVSLGIYRALFTNTEQERLADIAQVLRRQQLSAATVPKGLDPEGGISLLQERVTPHIFLCMVGGGHFAAMIVSLTPKYVKKQGIDERQATVIAQKTFHRYTTRRKQGGAQSANDAAKGNAHSAGSSLRRYNEAALETEIRALLGEWKSLITTSQFLFVRATGTANRRILFGPYEGQVLHHNDPRNRGFPFSTRRATQSELMRSFVELTRVKISRIDEDALEAARAQTAETERYKVGEAEKSLTTPVGSTTNVSAEDRIALLHTSQIEGLIRRSKVPGLLAYLSSNTLSVDFALFPTESQAHHHAPTMLHLASSVNSPAIVTALLVKGGADPTIANADGKTAFDIAGDRPTREAFRFARSEIPSEKWNWEHAHVPEPLTKAEINERNEREKQQSIEKEALRRQAEIDRIRKEEAQKEEEHAKKANDRREKKMGKGKQINPHQPTAEERREVETRGMTPEMKLRLEREKRARAAEERMKRLQGER